MMNEAAKQQLALDPNLDITSPKAYANPEKLEQDYAQLRATCPVAWVDREPYRPFWAVTRHADILEVERQHDLVINGPRLTLLPKPIEEQAAMAQPGPLESLRMLFALRRHSNQKEVSDAD